jgi:hypothetical protein
MKTLLATAVATAMLTGSAYAQMSKGAHKDPLELQYERQRKEQEDIERDYNAAMKRSRSQGAATAPKSDPWAGVRPTESSGPKR